MLFLIFVFVCMGKWLIFFGATVASKLTEPISNRYTLIFLIGKAIYFRITTVSNVIQFSIGNITSP